MCAQRGVAGCLGVHQIVLGTVGLKGSSDGARSGRTWGSAAGRVSAALLCGPVQPGGRTATRTPSQSRGLSGSWFLCVRAQGHPASRFLAFLPACRGPAPTPLALCSQARGRMDPLRFAPSLPIKRYSSRKIRPVSLPAPGPLGPSALLVFFCYRSLWAQPACPPARTPSAPGGYSRPSSPSEARARPGLRRRRVD